MGRLAWGLLTRPGGGASVSRVWPYGDSLIRSGGSSVEVATRSTSRQRSDGSLGVHGGSTDAGPVGLTTAQRSGRGSGGVT